MYKKILCAVIVITFLFSCTGFASVTSSKTETTKKKTVAMKKTVVKKPAAKTPVKKLVAKKAVVKKPATKKPIVKKPVAKVTPKPTPEPEITVKDDFVVSTPTPEPVLSASEKIAQGYLKKNTLGVEYKRNAALWLKYDDNIDTYGPDVDPADLKSPIMDGRYVAYLSNEGLDMYYAALKLTDKDEKNKKINEALSLEKMLWSLIVYREGMVPANEQIKKDLQTDNMYKVGVAEGFTFVFGWNDYKDSDLVGDSKTAFKELYEDVSVIRDYMSVFKPTTSEEGILNLKNIKFKLKDLYDKDVDESIFAQNKLTMINVWGTYCGPCIREMPILQQLTVDMKDKGFGVLGIVSDAFGTTEINPAIVKKAIQICDEAGVKYTSVLPDAEMKYNGIISYLAGVPTSFFVDSKGNIVGSVRIGDGTKEEYTKLIEDILASMK
jgi:thiol-disulfide isomerase/thioredoxin